uniref:EGF-like domain-containing protein n=1 Tax=Plectus sambesii TaxID=2011161 RepID=A0A914XJ16_9BILA
MLRCSSIAAAVFCSSLSIVVVATSVQLCLHGGLPIPNRPYCHCPRPYDGDYCQRISPCGMHGIVILGAKKCKCDDGWTGETCSQRLCAHGRLTADNQCQCSEGYEGEFCSAVNKCVHGHLQNGRCKCKADYEGDFCERIICDNRFGRLSSTNDSCECIEGREGLTCQQCIYPKYGPLCEHRHRPLLLSFKATHWALIGLIIPLFLTALCCLLVYCCCCRRILKCGGGYKLYNPPPAVVKSQRIELVLSPQSYRQRHSNTPNHERRSFIALGPKNAGVGPFPLGEYNLYRE